MLKPHFSVCTLEIQMSLLNVKYKFLIVTIFSKHSLLTKPVDGIPGIILGKYITIASSLYFFFEVIVQH